VYGTHHTTTQTKINTRRLEGKVKFPFKSCYPFCTTITAFSVLEVLYSTFRLPSVMHFSLHLLFNGVLTVILRDQEVDKRQALVNAIMNIRIP
jgi:hypothetical protein